MQILIEKCDRCLEEFEHLPGEVKIHFGGSTFGTRLTYDLCAECLDDVRKLVNNRP